MGGVSGEFGSGQNPKLYDNTRSHRIPRPPHMARQKHNFPQCETEQKKGKAKVRSESAGWCGGKVGPITHGAVVTGPPSSHLDPPQGGGPRPETEIHLSRRKGNAVGIKSLQSIRRNEILGET